MSLTWDRVDMKARMIRLEAGETKEGQPKRVPLAQALYDVLAGISRALHDPHVFLYRGKPIVWNFANSIMRAFKKADIAWGLEIKGGFIFHDLSHTFITDMRRAGVDRTVIMAITGNAIGYEHAL